MPVITTLAFYRNKQTISTFKSVRPKSLQAIRQAARDELADIQTRLHQLESHYLEDCTNHEDFARKHLDTIKKLLTVAEHRQIAQKMDFDRVCDKVKASREKALIYSEEIDQLRNLGQHIAEMNPRSFDMIIADINSLIKCMEKYCISLAPGTKEGGVPARGPMTEKQLETPYSYENQRQIRLENINELLKKIQTNSKHYGLKGVDHSFFSASTLHLFRGVDCSVAPFFFLFPESVELIEEACGLVRQWIDEDKEYADTLQSDIDDLSKEESGMQMDIRKQSEELNRFRHHISQLKQELEQERQQNSNHKIQVLTAEDQEHDAFVDIKKAQNIIARSKAALKELYEREEDYVEREFRSLVADHKRIISDNNQKIKEFQKIMYAAKERQKFYEARKSKWLENEEEFKKYLIEEKKIISEIKSSERELASLSHNLNLLRYILRLRNSPSTLKKIFLGLPIVCDIDTKAKNPNVELSTGAMESSNAGKKDKLDRAIKLTAKFIDQDWNILYSALPFYPLRGQADIDLDIDKVNKRHVRGSRREMALDILQVWRRFNNRANLDELKSALALIGKTNINDMIRNRIELGQHSHGRTDNCDTDCPGFGDTRLPPLTPITRLIHKHRKQAEENNLAKYVSQSRPGLLVL